MEQITSTKDKKRVENIFILLDDCISQMDIW